MLICNLFCFFVIILGYASINFSKEKKQGGGGGGKGKWSDVDDGTTPFDEEEEA
jgi:hypothetical protein